MHAVSYLYSADRTVRLSLIEERYRIRKLLKQRESAVEREKQFIA